MHLNKGISYLIRIELIVVLLFIILKGIRPYVLRNSNHEFIHIFLLSFPNFAEALAGLMVLTAILLLVIRRGLKWQNPSDPTIYIIAFITAGLYVILQEFKIHNLGGENVYDPFDVLFSSIGLLTGLSIVFYIRPSVMISGK